MELLIFIGLSLVNVVLGTMRSILTVKASVLVSAIINAVAFTFYNIVVSMIGGQALIAVIIVTFASNLIGVYIANWILTKAKKDKIWIITLMVEDEKKYNNALEELENENFFITLVPCKGKYSSFQLNAIQVISTTQNDSIKIIDIAEKYNIHYYALETIIGK